MDNEDLLVGDGAASGAEGAGAGDGGASGAENELLILDDVSEESASGAEKTEVADGDGAADGEGKKPVVTQDDKDAADYAPLVSGRIRGLVKKAPALGEVLKSNPEVQGVIEGIFRREAAFRDIFPTLAEAKELRERLPNGVQDLNTLVEETKELQTIDSAFYERGNNGDFPGHEQMIKDFYENDKVASIALFKQMPKVWATLDRESYNDVMGKIVGATFAGREIPEFVSGLLEIAEQTENEELVKGLKRLQGFVLSYTTEKKKTPQDEALERERADRARENSERSKTDQQSFQRTFVSSSLHLQKDIISKHPVMVKLAGIKSLSAEKKTEIQEKVRKSIELYLSNSPAFMKKMRAAHKDRNMEEIAKIQRSAWSQSWLLNKMIRTILRKETPQLISNRDATTRRASAPSQRQKPDNTGDRSSAEKTRPYQQGGQWYWPSGARMSTEDVLRGKNDAA